MKTGDLVDATTPFESYLKGLITHIDFSRKSAWVLWPNGEHFEVWLEEIVLSRNF
jgi:hypothetical protein